QPGNRPCALPLSQTPGRLIALVVVEGWRTAAVNPARLGVLEAVLGSLQDALALVLGQGRPSSNATGVINVSAELTTKRLELLRELVPNATRVAVLSTPSSPTAESQLHDVVAEANVQRLETRVVNARGTPDINEAFETIAQQRSGALLVIADSLFTSRR